MSMPRSRLAYERDLLFAFKKGMLVGYGIEHVNIHDEERRAAEDFIAEGNFKNDLGALERNTKE